MDTKPKILESIGKGGMGEVFLAHDSICGRDLALKEMKEEWREKKEMRERFLREAKIAAQLSHPNIIPIYAIAEDGTYYTMPHIEGETLKEIIKKTREQSAVDDPLHPIGGSIPALINIFLQVCSAIAYAHDRGVIHRDLKPDNIIIGKFGEVILLDWGLAHFVNDPHEGNFSDIEMEGELTLPGKIPGTLVFMAPERAFDKGSSISTDIYSLGVILYSLLTLSLPFKRKSLKEFKKLFEHERLLDPEEVAPDREISPILSTIVKKCLEPDPVNRFSSVQELIEELKHYSEGSPSWTPSALLDAQRKEDWLFQENIALSHNRALSKGTEGIEWVNLMVARKVAPGSLALEGVLSIEPGCKGCALFFSAEKGSFQKGIERGYCLWFTPGQITLLRSNVCVRQIDLSLKGPHTFRIEKVDDKVAFQLDDKSLFQFVSHIPLSGTQLGLIFRDTLCTLSPLQLFQGSQKLMVNCLAVPDAFLARNEFPEALTEYRRIAHSFPGRAEGREAMFRAGITLLRQGEKERSKKKKEEILFKALSEFGNLHRTPAGPLEYLGKSLVYRALNEGDEEAKCLELALRKYPKHPLKPTLIEHILTRLIEAAQQDRRSAFRLALLTLRHLPYLRTVSEMRELLKTYLEPLPFFLPSEDDQLDLEIQLAFWLKRPLVLREILSENPKPADEYNAKLALLLIGEELDLELSSTNATRVYGRFFHALLNRQALNIPGIEQVPSLQLWAALTSSDYDKASDILDSIPGKELENERSLAFPLYGCFLAHTGGEEPAKALLTQVPETRYPTSSTLLSHFLMGRLDSKGIWSQEAFFFEKWLLSKFLELYTISLS